MGVEDALVIAEVLGMVQAAGSHISTSQAVAGALQAYSTTRMERSQWLVRASRQAGDIYQWRHPVAGKNAEKCATEFGALARKIWDFNVDDMVADAKRHCHNLLLTETQSQVS